LVISSVAAPVDHDDDSVVQIISNFSPSYPASASAAHSARSSPLKSSIDFSAPPFRLRSPSLPKKDEAKRDETRREEPRREEGAGAGGGGAGGVSLVDHEVLELELHDLQLENDRLLEDSANLKLTLEQIMGEYELLVTEVRLRQEDHAANLGLVDTELKQQQAKLEVAEAERAAALGEVAALRAEKKAEAELAGAAQDRIRALEAELQKSKQNFEDLHNYAQQKLKSASEEYRKVVQAGVDKDTKLKQALADLEKHRLRADKAEAREKEATAHTKRLEQQVDELERSNNAASLSVSTLKAGASSLEQQVLSEKLRADENATMSNRFKEQLLQARETIRSLSVSKDLGAEAQKRLDQVDREKRDLESSNQQLKSKLFDIKERLEQTVGGVVVCLIPRRRP
jgi:chromosome segregation ATPase